jgi:hypothetical protein
MAKTGAIPTIIRVITGPLPTVVTAVTLDHGNQRIDHTIGFENTIFMGTRLANIPDVRASKHRTSTPIRKGLTRQILTQV